MTSSLAPSTQHRPSRYELRNPAIEAIKLDITDQADIAAAADIAPDMLLNNAGRGQLGPRVEVPMELVRQVFEVNVFGTIGITQAIIPSIEDKGWGRSSRCHR